MSTKTVFSTEDLSTIMKTPADAKRLLDERQAANQELARTASEACARYYADVNADASKLQERLEALDNRCTAILGVKENVKKELIRATIDGKEAVIKEKEQQLRKLDLQLASLKEQIEAIECHVLRGDQKLFDQANESIDQYRDDCVELQEFVNTVKEEARQISKEWDDIADCTIIIGRGLNSKQIRELYDRHGTGAETVKEHIERCAKEAAATAENQRLVALQEERERKAEEEIRARQEALNKPAPYRSFFNAVTGKTTCERYNPETGKYEPCIYPHSGRR